MAKVAQAVAEVVAAIVECAAGQIVWEILANYRITDDGCHPEVVNIDAASGSAGNIFFDLTPINNQWIWYRRYRSLAEPRNAAAET